jgi:uncharacterized protein (DUF1800 family)
MIDSKTKHLCNRAVFGMRPEDWERTPQDPFTLLDKQAGIKPIRVAGTPGKEPKTMLNKEVRKAQQKELKDVELLLNTTWFTQLTDPATTWREKMVLFWHDHFACRTKIPFLAQQQNNTIREHALGKFGDLLMAVSKDPAMLQFLNNKQNRKGHPNENFAREVMELFTLGRGNYSEDDIKNAARAFTGWAFQPKTYEFAFLEGQHDFDTKSFRGKSGSFDGQDIITMILEDKQTASFITSKIWKHFVNDELPDETVTKELADVFYKSDYNISKLMAGLFNHPRFYHEANIASHIKSPIELLTGIVVHTGGTFNHPGNIIFLQKAMGQVLFLPPNVGGWPQGKEWIDSSSLTFRMGLPTILFKNSATEFQGKDDGDANEVINQFKQAGKISFNVNWQKLADVFTRKTEEETVTVIENYLLPKPAIESSKKLITEKARAAAQGPEYVKKLFTGFMSLPEYQLS